MGGQIEQSAPPPTARARPSRQADSSGSAGTRVWLCLLRAWPPPDRRWCSLQRGNRRCQIVVNRNKRIDVTSLQNRLHHFSGCEKHHFTTSATHRPRGKHDRSQSHGTKEGDLLQINQ